MDVFNLDVRRAHHMGKRLSILPTLYGPSIDYRTSREIEITIAILWIPRDRRKSYDGLLLSTKRRKLQLQRLGIGG